MNGGPKTAGDVAASRSPIYADATRQIRRGNFVRARELSASLAQQFPESATVWSLKAAIAAASNDYKLALAHIEEAQLLDPENVGILAHKANTLAVLRMHSAARSTADQAFLCDTEQADVLATLGTAYVKIGDFTKSLACFKRAVKYAPRDAAHQYNLGTALRFAGDFKAAERCFDRTIALRPTDCETFYARSGLRIQSVEDNHIDELENALVAGSLSWRDEVLLCYSLAKEMEDLEMWGRSFAYLKRGADLRRANMRYDVQKDRDKMEKIASAFTSQKLSSKVAACHSPEPIFILGLPRAGSTLIERILSSHGDVTSAGELQNFAIELMRPIFGKAKTTQVDFDDVIAATLTMDFEALGDSYLKSANYLTAGAAHFTDKMPMNFLYVGLIHLALPRSKIIHVYRDPMDACYAMYKIIFKGAYPFSYDLHDIGRYYVAYHRLMRHWNECLPGRLLNIKYEDLISDQESTTRKLLEYCGLEWQEQCLSFDKLKTAATTASAVEVRRPIYSSSVEKWKNYRAYLGDLENYLREQNIVA